MSERMTTSSSPPEVQAKVLADFQPLRDGENSYSGLFTAFVKKTRQAFGIVGRAVDHAGSLTLQSSGFPTPPLRHSLQDSGTFDAPLQLKDAEGALVSGSEELHSDTSGNPPEGNNFNFGSTESSDYMDDLAPLDLLGVSSKPVGNEESVDLEWFRLKYPMDERAYTFLLQSPRDVQIKVLETFTPQRLNTSPTKQNEQDYSAPITAYVRACRTHYEQESAAGHACDEAVLDFFTRYPVDQRARDYFDQCSVEVRGKVVRDFRPKQDGDLDYSAALTSFITRCRNYERPRYGTVPAGGWGPPHKKPRYM